MKRIYGYCRISRKTQNIERQERNIIAQYPTAIIRKEAYTGTKVQGRKEFERLLNEVRAGDTIVFDSVSRMSRSAAEGIDLYMQLLDRGIELVFLKEPHINTETYKHALDNSIDLVGNEIADIYIQATNKVLRILAVKQIQLAFEQAEKEVTDLQQRTKEGIETARRNGKQVGQKPGKTLTVKKKAPAIAFIEKNSRAFGGTLTDEQCARAAGISRRTLHTYKQEIIQAQSATQSAADRIRRAGQILAQAEQTTAEQVTAK